MKYQVQYNPVAKLYVVWAVYTYGAEAVKHFKTEAGARRWIEKQG